jgi:hypothetical protein
VVNTVGFRPFVSIDTKGGERTFAAVNANDRFCPGGDWQLPMAEFGRRTFQGVLVMAKMG